MGRRCSERVAFRGMLRRRAGIVTRRFVRHPASLHGPRWATYAAERDCRPAPHAFVPRPPRIRPIDLASIVRLADFEPAAMARLHPAAWEYSPAARVTRHVAGLPRGVGRIPAAAAGPRRRQRRRHIHDDPRPAARPPDRDPPRRRCTAWPTRMARRHGARRDAAGVLTCCRLPGRGRMIERRRRCRTGLAGAGPAAMYVQRDRSISRELVRRPSSRPTTGHLPHRRPACPRLSRRGHPPHLRSARTPVSQPAQA